MTEPSASQIAQRSTYLFAARLSVVVIAVVAVVGSVVGWFVADLNGVWTALAGAATAAIFGIVTTVAAWWGAKGDPATFIAWVMGTWILKIAAVIGASLAFSAQEWLVRPLYGAILVAGAMAALAVDIVALQRSRVPYVDAGL